MGSRRILSLCATAAACVCLALGISLPFMAMSQPPLLGFPAGEQSLISAVDGLLRTGNLVLSIALLILALFIPTLRLLYHILIAALPIEDIKRSAESLSALAWLGRWSTHDVLALAVGAAIVLAHGPTQRLGDGAHFYAAAILAMLVGAGLRRDLGFCGWHPPGEIVATSAAGRGWAFVLVVGAATAALALGLALPVVQFTSTYAGAAQHSAASMVVALHRQDEPILSLGILALAAVLPGLRLLHLWMLVACRSLPGGTLRSRMVALTRVLGPYAIVDAILLTLLLIYLSASGLAKPTLQPGAYALLASAALTLTAFAWSNRAPQRPQTLAARLSALEQAETQAEAPA